jgi:photosystem II stability/assembly factor-like uncharacterized protein
MQASSTLLLGTRKGLLTLERGSAGWQVARKAHLGNPVAYAAQDRRTGHTWACMDYGHWGQKLMRSADGGETWARVEAPKYPEGATYKTGEPGEETQREVPATLLYLWVLEPAVSDEPGRVYIGTVPGGLFRSDASGESFELVRGLWDHPSRLEKWFGGGKDHPGIHSILQDPRDPRRMLVGISCAGVFETTDGGETWEPRNKGLTANFLPDPNAEIGHDPHFLTWCAANPDVLWQQNHCGIFRSEDGAQSWQLVSEEGGPAHFGFAIAADPLDPLTAWVVPAGADEQRQAVGEALCVCRTNDGGKSWSTLRKGLPQENCYDLVFRHGLDVSGDTLAFGTTTGNVYISEDRGDSWSCLGTHFPPVYSVRFAPPA